MDPNTQQQTPPDDVNALENASPSNTINTSSPPPLEKPKTSIVSKIVKKLSFLNIYLLLFMMIVIIAGIIIFVGIRNNQSAVEGGQINAQTLSSQALSNLTQNNTIIGDPKQTLTVASDSVFNGKALFRDSLDVAGTIRVGGALSLPGITVSGNSTLENVAVANSLSIGGDTTIAGNLSVQRNLIISGDTSFGGNVSATQLSIDGLTVNQDLRVNRHIRTGGGVPGISTGPATGGGGTSNISGTDTAGTITINAGGSPSTGVLATINFVTAYSGEPRILLSPVSSGAGNLNWYVTRTANGFTIYTNNPPASAASLSFDYFVIN